VKTWDVIIIGGGIIGLSLSIALRKRGAKVLVVERGERGLETPALLQPLAAASARMYPEFAHELQDESGIDVDLRDQGTILFPAEHLHAIPGFGSDIAPRLGALEPALSDPGISAVFLPERSVDPRALGTAALRAAKHRDVDISSGTEVKDVLLESGRVAGVRTEKTSYAATAVVNCAGAWAGHIPPHRFPTRPVKGQMLSVVGAPRNVLRHVIRAPEVYLVPRSDGRIVIGSTLEEAGFDKRTDVDTIQRLHHAAIGMVPALSEARMLEAWAGLRPGTPDALPILGATAIPGYFVATGHFRDGILLAPITAHLMAQVITGIKPEIDISAFSPARFAN
jgi:glycine oxidase